MSGPPSFRLPWGLVITAVILGTFTIGLQDVVGLRWLVRSMGFLALCSAVIGILLAMSRSS